MTIFGQLNEAAAKLPAAAHCDLYCSPPVFDDLLDDLDLDDDGRVTNLGSTRTAEVHVVFAMDDGAWRLEHDGETIAGSPADEAEVQS
jgi:hypothetical protein